MEHILVYFDNNNLFVPAMKHGLIVNQTNIKFEDGITQDSRVRINYSNLYSIIRGERRTILKPKCYGPPTKDEKTTNKDGETKSSYVPEDEIQYIATKTSTFNNKEKRADTALVAHAVHDMWRMKARAGFSKENWALVLCTGDEDMLPLCAIAKELGFKIEVWAFDSPLSGELKAKADRCVNIEHIFKEISFIQRVWNELIPAENRAITLRFRKGYSHPSLEDIVDSVSEILRQPTQGQWIRPKAEHLRDIDYNFLAVVMVHHPDFEEGGFHYNFKKSVLSKKKTIKERIQNCDKVDAFRPDTDYRFPDKIEGKEVPELCELGFRCFKRFTNECNKKHTREQNEFFQLAKKEKYDVRNYKSTMCKRLKCFYPGSRSYLCTFAHSEYELYCPKCKVDFHKCSK